VGDGFCGSRQVTRESCLNCVSIQQKIRKGWGGGAVCVSFYMLMKILGNGVEGEKGLVNLLREIRTREMEVESLGFFCARRRTPGDRVVCRLKRGLGGRVVCRGVEKKLGAKRESGCLGERGQGGRI